MDNQNFLNECENILLKESKVNFSATNFCYDQYNNQKLALSVFRYTFETVLKWTPTDIMNRLNMDIIQNLNLTTPFKYIIFPEELNKRKDFFYIAHLLYPLKIPYNMRNYVIKIYQDIIERDNGRFSSNFFIGTEGELRACICLQYLIKEYLSFTTIEEVYYYFSTPKAKSTLRQFCLSTICFELFESPLEFLHIALPDKQKNELYYQYYRFEAELKTNKLKGKVRRIIGC